MGYWSNVLSAIRGKASSVTPEMVRALLAYDGGGSDGKVGESYRSLAVQGFMRNVFAYRAISDIAAGAASVPLVVFVGDRERPDHPLAQRLQSPNPRRSLFQLLLSAFTYHQLAGRAFYRAVSTDDTSPPLALQVLRPDWVTVKRQRNAATSMPETVYRYEPTTRFDRFETVVPDDAASGEVHEFGSFHPLSETEGFASLRSARTAIERHNWIERWNTQLLENSGRPPGALSVKRIDKDDPGTLDTETEERVLKQIAEKLEGPANAGRIALLQGGLEFLKTGFSPAEMEWSESKVTAARDVATALRYPSFLFGIPGDNTYSNQREARLALWEETIIPLVQYNAQELTTWLAPRYRSSAGSPVIVPNFDSVSALALRIERIWDRVASATWLTPNEQRMATGYEERPEPEADQLYIDATKVPLTLIEEIEDRPGTSLRSVDELEHQRMTRWLIESGWPETEAREIASRALDAA